MCTVWDLPFASPSRMHCRQSLEGRSHFLPPAVKYSVRPEIIWDSFQGLALFKYAGNNGQGIKWSTDSPKRGTEVLHPQPHGKLKCYLHEHCSDYYWGHESINICKLLKIWLKCTICTWFWYSSITIILHAPILFQNNKTNFIQLEK